MDTATVAELWRYPVKSMAGESIRAARVAPGIGLEGDRGFAIVDVETGHVASAKHPRRWATLLQCRATLRTPGQVDIGLPDGTRVDSVRPGVDARLSALVGRPVRLSSTPPAQATFDEYDVVRGASRGAPLALGAGAGTFFDFAPIHLVTTATLRRLRELLPGSQVERVRFRPNLVIDTGEASEFLENAWNGRLIAIGKQVVLHVVFTCPRCVMTTLAQPGIAADPAILRAAAEHNPQWFPLLGKKLPTVGMYATVVRGGSIAVGDDVRVGGTSRLRRIGAALQAVRRLVRRR
jgi:uncharacterized protein